MTKEDSYKARYRFKKDGKRHILIFSEVTLEDGGRFKVMTNGGQCEADLIVEGTGAPRVGRGSVAHASPCSGPIFGIVLDASLCLNTLMQFTSKSSEEFLNLTPPHFCVPPPPAPCPPALVPVSIPSCSDHSSSPRAGGCFHACPASHTPTHTDTPPPTPPANSDPCKTSVRLS